MTWWQQQRRKLFFYKDFGSDSCICCLRNEFCCSLWFHFLSHQEITLWCCCLSTQDTLLGIKQTSKVTTKKSWQNCEKIWQSHDKICSLLFNVEILAKLTVLTYTHWNKSLKSPLSLKYWKFPCHHLWRDKIKGCSASTVWDPLYNHTQIVQTHLGFSRYKLRHRISVSPCRGDFRSTDEECSTRVEYYYFL